MKNPNPIANAFFLISLASVVATCDPNPDSTLIETVQECQLRVARDMANRVYADNPDAGVAAWDACGQ